MNIDYIKKNYAKEEEIEEIKGTIETIENLVETLNDYIYEYELLKEILMIYNKFQPIYKDGEWSISNSRRYFKTVEGLLGNADRKHLQTSVKIFENCGIDYEINEYDYYYALESKISVKERNLLNKTVKLDNADKTKSYKK